MTIGLIALSIIGDLCHLIPAHWSAAVGGTAGTIYIVARSVLKFTGQGAAVDVATQVAEEVRQQLAVVASKRAEEVKP